MIFRYVVTDQNGKQIKGEKDMKSRESLVEFLHSQDYIVESIEEKVSVNFSQFAQIQIGGYSLKDRLLVTKQLLAMLQAGLPITQAMNVLVEQAPNPSMSKDILKVYEDLQNGMSLSKAFAKNTKIYNEVQSNLIAAGEKSGNLIEILGKIQDDMAKSHRLKNKIRNAMIYPSIIFIGILLVVVVLVLFMVPQMEKLYEDLNIESLPFITIIIVKIAHFFASIYGIISALFVGISIFFSFYYYRSTKGGKKIFHRLFLKLPVFGNLNEMIQVAEFSRLLSLLLSSGVPIINALEIVGKSTSNVIFAEAVFTASKKVSKGAPLAVPLSESRVFPEIFTRVVVVGEETGKLDQVLLDMAKFYDEEVSGIADNLTKLMEPFILLVVGFLVAFLALAVYWPIYSLGDKI